MRGETSRPSGQVSPSSLEDPVDPTSLESEEPLLNGNLRWAAMREFYQGFESLNYEFDPAGLDVDISKNESAFNKLYRGAVKWSLCLLLGVTIAVVAFTVNVSVENLAGVKFWATLHVMRSTMFGSYLIYTLANCLLVAAASFFVVYYGPAAIGSGIPDVKSFLNGVDVPRVLYPSTLVAKVIGSIGAVSGSLAVGKEGPFVHTGACLAFLLSQGKRVHRYLSWPIFNLFTTDRHLRDFVTCGAAAGVAAAFRAPVGGVLFALEEAASWWRNQILWLAFFTTAVVSIILRTMIDHCSTEDHKCGFFGMADFILFNLSDGQQKYELFELVPMMLLGILGGLLGTAFNSMSAQLTIWRNKFFRHRPKRDRILEVVAVAFLTSTISFCLPLMVSCQKCPITAADMCPRNPSSYVGNYVSFQCGENEHNDLATLFFNTQDAAIRSLLSSKTDSEYTERTLLIYFVFFYFLAVITYGTALPTGLFVPCILCGSSYGRLVGMYVSGMNPERSIDEGTYALLGAAGFLAGSTRMTVSLCVIILELTNNLTLLPLIMLVLLIAKGVGDASGIKAIYDLHVGLKGIPFLEPHPEAFMQNIKANELSVRPVIQFRKLEKINTLIQVLQTTTHNAFPVVDRNSTGENVILGMLLRSSLEERLFSSSTEPQSPSSSNRSNLAKTYDEEDWLDLQPMLNNQIYVVDEDMAASKVYALFRTLGLRHLLVVPRSARVTGIVSRKDLLPDLLHAKFPSDLSVFPNNRMGPTETELAQNPLLSIQPNKAD